MTKIDLINFLESIGVNKSNYSLNEGLKPNAIILDEIDGLWKITHYDEKGNETLINLSKSEQEAYNFIKKKYLEDLKIMGKTKF